MIGLDSQEDPDNPEMVSNEILLRKFEEKIASLDAKNSALLITMKEFGRVAHDVYVSFQSLQNFSLI